MYSQIQQVGLKAYSLAELPPLAFSVIVAETPPVGAVTTPRRGPRRVAGEPS